MDNKTVIWKDIYYNGLIIKDWEINEYGLIRNKITGELKQGHDNVKNKDLHQRVSIKHKLYYVHRLVAEAFIPNPKNFKVVRHKDDNPRHNHYTNLEWGTHHDNTMDAIKNGKIKYDENRNYIRNQDHPASVLKNKEVEKICKKLSQKIPISDIAKEFNVSRDVILHIYKGNSWKNISAKYFPFPEQRVYNPLPNEIKYKIIIYLKENPNAKPLEISRKFNLPIDNKTKCFIQFQKRKMNVQRLSKG